MIYESQASGERLSRRALQDRLGVSFPPGKPPAGWQPYTPPAPTLEELKLRKRREIEARRQAAIEDGFLHGAIPVQTGAQDRENLQGLTTAAQLRKANSDTTPLDFRDADNAMHSLTPDEVIALGLAAMAHVQAQYQHSWTLKAQIDAAASPADLDAITW